MILSKAELIDLYRRRARRYDLTANLYHLIGFWELAYRRRAVSALHLKPGDTVVDLACGTGLNFSLLRDAVGPQGRIIGVDINDAMLGRARERTSRRGLENVEIVESDAARFDYPDHLSGVLSTFAITLIPEFDDVIRRGAQALGPSGRLTILDFKRPSWAPLWLVKASVAIMAPFGVTLELADRHPWESLERHFAEFHMQDLYWGFSYLATGEVVETGAQIASVAAR